MREGRQSLHPRTLNGSGRMPNQLFCRCAFFLWAIINNLNPVSSFVLGRRVIHSALEFRRQDFQREPYQRQTKSWLLSSPESDDRPLSGTLGAESPSLLCETDGDENKHANLTNQTLESSGIVPVGCQPPVINGTHPLLTEKNGVTGDGRWFSEDGTLQFTRRRWIHVSSTLVIGCAAAIEAKQQIPNLTKADAFPQKKIFRPVNATRIWQETSINVTMQQGPPLFYFALDPNTFQKKRALMLPPWIPSWMVPPPVVIRDITNEELLSAAIVAGSVVEMTRTLLLYPLLTLKTRVQSDINTRRKKGKHPPLRIGTRFKYTIRTAKKYWGAGDLYAGLFPALVITVPATGLYYGIRDVVKRTLLPMLSPSTGNVPVLLLAAFAGDVVALAFRTPADTLSLRLQAEAATAARNVEVISDDDRNRNQTKYFFVDFNHTGTDMFSERKAGNWFFESIERLPAVVITDLPYLLSRIALNSSILKLQGSTVGVGRYEATVVFTAILCAFLTTPFDVARTRILIDSTTTSRGSQASSDDEVANGVDMGTGEGLIATFRSIYNEGDGGLRNLFAGWLERTLYLGIGRACLEPLQLIGYMLIRDRIILEWFD